MRVSGNLHPFCSLLRFKTLQLLVMLRAPPRPGCIIDPVGLISPLFLFTSFFAHFQITQNQLSWPRPSRHRKRICCQLGLWDTPSLESLFRSLHYYSKTQCDHSPKGQPSGRGSLSESLHSYFLIFWDFKLSFTHISWMARKSISRNTVLLLSSIVST